MGSFFCFMQVDELNAKCFCDPDLELTKLNPYGCFCFALEQLIDKKNSELWNLHLKTDGTSTENL